MMFFLEGGGGVLVRDNLAISGVVHHEPIKIVILKKCLQLLRYYGNLCDG